MSRAAAERSILPVTLGTAGHIDHGKTTLLRALAGGEADTDRLDEERARGLTIDVGYAELALDDGVEVGVVDVPGHERFVRNMVAGATGIDVVLLAVAADDGVMPQTREHLDIMSLLGLRSGVIAVTKSDLVDAEMVELVRSELEDLVRGTFLEGAMIVPVSGVTGMGLDTLRAEITRLVRAAALRDAEGFFRMPVLRVFTSQGFGTVVTGIPVSGRLAVGDRVEVQPGARSGRVRGLQVYHRPSETAAAGHRTAINVAELGHRAIERGDVVCEPGVFAAADLVDVRLTTLRSISRPLRHDQEVRLHVGTVECAARVLLVGAKRQAADTTGYAQLKLDRPVVIAPGDRFIVRLPAQLVTLGGGVILGRGEHGRGRRRASMAEQFAERERGLTDRRVALESSLRRAGPEGRSRADLVLELMRRRDEIDVELGHLLDHGSAVELDRGVILHTAAATALRDAVLTAVSAHHERSPLAIGMKKADLAGRVRAPEVVIEGVVQQLAREGLLELLPQGRLRASDFRPQLSEAQLRRRQRILDVLASDPWQTPRSNDLPHLIEALPDESDKLLALLEDEGLVVKLRDGVLFLVSTIDDAKATLLTHFKENGTLVPADLKQLFGITRKYGIPLLEHLDTIGFTRRDGDRRRLRG